ncbi:MAG: hypothetical protein HC807_05450 [Gammaproteobacteria bacterium]|nr:hypothetical protein [Gammaproteobacteria bacterium]
MPAIFWLMFSTFTGFAGDGLVSSVAMAKTDAALESAMNSMPSGPNVSWLTLMLNAASPPFFEHVVVTAGHAFPFRTLRGMIARSLDGARAPRRGGCP